MKIHCLQLELTFHGGDEYYNGYYDDIRFYATTLSADDVKQLYESKARIDKNGNLYCNEFIEEDVSENLLETYQYPTNSSSVSGTYTKELVDCEDSVTGQATKITCTVAGTGIYIGGCWSTAKAKFINGEQYIWSMYIKSDNRTNIKFNVECSSKQSKNNFEIDTTYRRIESVFTYSNSTTYSAFTCYPTFAVDDNIYIHSFSVCEYKPETNVNKQGILNAGQLVEINNDKKCKIYKQDIQVNTIIEN
jgi:hypothetical protein